MNILELRTAMYILDNLSTELYSHILSFWYGFHAQVSRDTFLHFYLFHAFQSSKFNSSNAISNPPIGLKRSRIATKKNFVN